MLFKMLGSLVLGLVLSGSFLSFAEDASTAISKDRFSLTQYALEPQSDGQNFLLLESSEPSDKDLTLQPTEPQKVPYCRAVNRSAVSCLR